MTTTFTGDLGNLSLAEILQTLSSGAKEGILVVDGEAGRQEVLVSAGSVSVIEKEFDQRPGLVHQCLALGLIENGTALEILQARSRTGRSVTDLLRREAGVSNDSIDQLRHLWYQDRILRLFERTTGSFSFRDDPSVGRRITSGELPTFPVGAIVMESARQQDELGVVVQTLPHEGLVLEPTGVEVELDEDGREILGHLTSLLDGRTTLTEAIDRSYLTRFDFMKWAADLVASGALRVVGGAELIERARQMAAMPDSEVRGRALVLYDSCLRDAPDGAIALERAHLLWALGRRREAADVYAEQVPRILAGGRPTEAYQLVEAGLEALENHDALEETIPAFLPDHVAALGDDRPAFLVRASNLVERWTRERRTEESLDLIERLVDEDATNEAVRHRAINLAIDLGRTEQAAGHYEKMAAYCVATGEWGKLVDIYQRILRLDPDRGGIRKKLENAQRKVNAQVPGFRHRRWKGRLAWAGALAVVGLLVLWQYGSYASYQDLEIDRLESEHRYQDALDELDEYRESHFFGVGTFLATGRQARVREAWAAHREERSRRMEPERDQARQLAADGDFDGAVARLDEILRGQLTDEFQFETLDLKKEIQVEARQLAALRQSVAESLARGDHEEAFFVSRRILETYGDRPRVAESLRLPVHLVVLPPDAVLEVDGQALGPVGPDRILPIAPGEAVSVRISRSGYETAERTIGDREATVAVDLTKIARWTRDTGLRIALDPVASDRRLYLATRDGELVAFDVGETLREAWRYRVPGGARLLHPPTPLAGGDVVFSATDGQIYRLDRAGKKSWSTPSGGEAPGRPRALPGGEIVVSIGQRLAIVSADGRQTAMRPAGVGEGATLVGNPAVSPDGRRIAAVLTDRRLICLDPATRDIAWEKRLPSPATTGPIVAGDRFLLQTEDLFIRAFRITDGAADGLHPLFSRLSQDPVAIGERVYLVKGDLELTAIDPSTGRAPIACRLPFAPTSRPTAFGGTLAVAGPGGQVAALDASSLAMRWTYRASGELLHPVGCAEQLVLVTSDGRIVALEP